MCVLRECGGDGNAGVGDGGGVFVVGVVGGFGGVCVWLGAAW